MKNKNRLRNSSLLEELGGSINVREKLRKIPVDRAKKWLKSNILKMKKI